MNEIAIILVSLFCIALFTGSEAAFLSSNKLFFELDRKRRTLISYILGLFYRYSSLFLISLSIASAVSVIVFSLQAHVLLYDWLRAYPGGDIWALLPEIALISVVVILFGRFIPQLVFTLNPYLSLYIVALPLYLICLLLLPVSLLFLSIAKVVCRLFCASGTGHFNEKALDRGDLGDFIRETIKQSPENASLETEVRIFRNALDFSRVRLKDCMVPRTEIVALDVEADKSELLSRFIETGLSKILIYNESIDNIVGYIHSAEMFANPGHWQKGIKSVPIAPETMAANKLMKVLMQEKKTIAIVVDEFGGTSGIVTLEDLVEEIFGDFEDEHDTTNYVAKKISDTEFVLSGRMEVDKVNEMFGLDIPESDEYQTIAGLILFSHQRFPQFNEPVAIDRFLFTVVKKTAAKIELVKLKISPE